MRFAFYLSGMEQLTGLSQEDWQFLSEIADENGVAPATLASMIISSELDEWRDYLRHIESENDNLATVQEKQVEELMV